MSEHFFMLVMTKHVAASLKDVFGDKHPAPNDPQRVLLEENVKNFVVMAKERESEVGYLDKEVPEITMRCLRCMTDLSFKDWKGTDHYKTCTASYRESIREQSKVLREAHKAFNFAKAINEMTVRDEIVKQGKLIASKNNSAAIQAQGFKKREPKPSVHQFNLLSWNVRTMEGAMRQGSILGCIETLNSRLKSEDKGEVDFAALQETHAILTKTHSRFPGTIFTTQPSSKNKKGGLAMYLRSQQAYKSTRLVRTWSKYYMHTCVKAGNAQVHIFNMYIPPDFLKDERE